MYFSRFLRAERTDSHAFEDLRVTPR
jgi:hypothetical protein